MPASESIRFSQRDLANFARFGCTFVGRQKLICFQWRKEWQSKVATAQIVARLVSTESTSGPLLCLAFEMSPTKALPQYSFFPFDLKNRTHRTYLSSVCRTGTIGLSFRIGLRQILRIHQVPPRARARMTELYETAIAKFEKLPVDLYDFERAVGEFERNIRPADYLGYGISDADLQKLIRSANEAAAKVSPEERAQAAGIANQLLGVFRPHYEAFREPMRQLPSLARAFLVIWDLQREFEGDYERLVQLMADAIASHTPKEDLRELQTVIPLLQLLLALADQARTFVMKNDEGSQLQVQGELREMADRVGEGRGISFGALKNVLANFGLQLGGKPGRTPEDYSTEYDLKAAGRTWPAAAEWTLENDAATSQEFGGRKYKDLSWEQKTTLTHRVREGVRSYAKRMGKPFPPRKESVLVSTPQEAQTNG